ncbi:unnamed protein product [Arctogadus glacialis]
MRASLVKGDLGADVFVNRTKILRNQLEHSELQSSGSCWARGRGGGGGGGEVEEWDRVGLELVSVEVHPLDQGAAQRLRLDSAPDSETVRLQVCLETLGVEEETVEGVPAHLRLPVAVTRYWLRRASPEPTLLKALLMVMVQGELTRRAGGTTGSFNQWQACLNDPFQLNLLLCKPLPEPHFAWAGLCTGSSGSSRRGNQRTWYRMTGDRRLYRRLLGAVTQPDPGANRRAGGPEGQLRASMEHLHLNTQEEEEEELGGAKGLDQGSDRPRVSVRTRHGNKDRKDRSRNPELGRKQEREGWG